MASKRITDGVDKMKKNEIRIADQTWFDLISMGHKKLLANSSWAPRSRSSKHFFLVTKKEIILEERYLAL